MIKKGQKKDWFRICFFLFFLCTFFIPGNKIFAALEINYPTISGHSIDASTQLPGYVIYLFSVGMSVGFGVVFISLIIAGVLYFFAPISAEARSNARDRISGSITGLLILMLTYLIISTINPQLSIFNINKLSTPTVPPVTVVQKPGVYFYTDSSCSDTSIQANTLDIPNLGPLKKNVGSIKIVQDSTNNTYYVAMAYENPNFWGKCHYIDPNTPCESDSFFKTMTSASIYQYDTNPSGDGIYFFRKACFGSSPFSTVKDLISFCKQNGGGYLKISNSDIANGGGGDSMLEKKLDDLQFTGDGGGCTVPEEEQDCTTYNKSGNCTQRSCPTLAGENISSMIMDGSYLVVFYHNSSGTDMDSCQEFPTSNDINGFGPRQMKWEIVRNNENAVPAGFFVIPIIQPQKTVPASATITPLAP